MKRLWLEQIGKMIGMDFSNAANISEYSNNKQGRIYICF